MDDIKKNFIYLSQIIKLPVVDSATGRTLGCAVDIVAGLREMYPRVSGLVVRASGQRRRFYIPWSRVKELVEEKAITVENSPDLFKQRLVLSETEILLGETLWDKQIVDISGSKVVRVNDLHLLKDHTNLWVVHIDVGLTGLLRRLGCLRWVSYVVDLVSSYELKDRLISWKFVQPVSPTIGGNALSLTIHHSKLSELHPAELADILLGLGTDERMVILKSLDNTAIANVFARLPLKVRIQIAELTEEDCLAGIVHEMPMDEAADLLSQLSAGKRELLYTHLPKEKTEQLTDLIKYSKRIAGSIMNTEFICVAPTATAGEVLEKIRKECKKKESIYHTYVVDAQGKLMGLVTLRQLLSGTPERVVSHFMRKQVVKVVVDMHIKDVAEIFRKYDFTIVPVVDEHGRIEGIISMKDAFETVYPKIKDEGEETQFTL